MERNEVPDLRKSKKATVRHWGRKGIFSRVSWFPARTVKRKGKGRPTGETQRKIARYLSLERNKLPVLLRRQKKEKVCYAGPVVVKSNREIGIHTRSCTAILWWIKYLVRGLMRSSKRGHRAKDGLGVVGLCVHP